MWRLLAPGPFGHPLVSLGPTDPPGGGGGDDDDELDDPPPVPATVSGDAALAMRDYRDSVGSWLRKQRRTVAGYRTRARAAEETAATERQAREGKTVIEGAELAAFDAYKALGAPADLTRRLADADTATLRLTTLERETVVRDAATRHGYDFDALRAHAGDLPLTPYEADEEGVKVTKYRVGAGTEQADMAEWVGKQPAYVQRALTPTEQANGTGQRQGTGVTYPAQHGGGGTRPETSLASGWSDRKAKAAESRQQQ